MGRYVFTIPDCDRFTGELLMRAQIIGLEGIPWTGQAVIEGNQLVVDRHVETSGRLLVPFQSDHHGPVFLVTATLPEADQPWPLDLELARGSLSRLRNQVAIWEESGLVIPPAVRRQIDGLITGCAAALFSENGQATERTRQCVEVIDQSVDLMFVVADQYSRQVDELSHQLQENIPVQCGIVGREDQATRLGLDLVQQFPEFPAADPRTGKPDVNSLQPVVQWASRPPPGLVRVIGPLLDFGVAELPAWLDPDATYEQRLAITKSVCQEIGRCFGHDLKLVHALAGISGVGQPRFNYPQQLQMSIEILETLDRTLPNTSALVSFDQPWGERLATANGGVPAMEIAESLLRYGARVSALGLEINLGYWPQGTLIRDPLQWVDLIDRWSQFGLPLVVYLSAPIPGPTALPDNRFARTVCPECLEPGFADYLATVLNLLKSRPAVNVILWKFSDNATNPRFPASGLLEEPGDAKPGASRLIQILRG